MSDSNCQFQLEAHVLGEQVSVELQTEESALAMKHALTDAGHTAGVYVSCGIDN